MKKKEVEEKKETHVMIIWIIVIALIIIIPAIIAMLESPKNIIRFSELKWENHYVIGKVQNTDPNNAYDMTIYFSYKSGNLKEDGICFEEIGAGETKDFQCLEYDIDETFEIKVDNIELEKIED